MVVQLMVASREDILNQIEITLASISGVKTCARDRGLLDEDEKPAIILLDGREDIAQTDVVRHKSVRMPPAIFRLQPQIFVVLPQRDTTMNTTLNGLPAPIGPELSAWRDLILGALINDPTLVGLLGSEGQITYQGHETDMQTGRTLLGAMQLFVHFHYVWFPPQG
jgi:hypothetical protein